MNRRLFLGTVIATPALAVLAAACGDDSTDDGSGSTPEGSGGSTPGTSGEATIDHPTGADDVVLRLTLEGGFVPAEIAFANLPTVLVSGDRRWFAPAVTTMQFPGPLVPAVTVRTVEEGVVQEVLAVARDAGLLAAPPDYSAQIMVADVPDTVLRLTAAGNTYEHRAAALGYNIDGSGNSIPEATPARQALLEFVTWLSEKAASGLGAEQPFSPDEYRVRARAVADDELSNLDVEPTVVEWPSDAGLRLAEAPACGTVPATGVGALFAEATQVTFFSEDGVTYALAVAPVLPGDSVC